MKKIILFFAFHLMLISLMSQSFDNKGFKRFSIDINGGLPYVSGDITNKLGGYNATGRLNYCLTRAFSIGGEFSIGKVSGLNKDSEAFYFTNKYMKAFVGAEMYLFSPFKFYEFTNFFQPYIGANVGMIKSDVEDYGSTRYGVDPKHFNDWVYASQLHVGAKFKLAKFLDANVRYSFATIKSDLFDNHSPRFFANKYNDVLATIEVGVTMHIGGKGKEPIIWAGSECCGDNKSKEEKALEDEILQNKLDEMAAKLDSLQGDVADLTDGQKGLQNQIDSINATIIAANQINLKDSFFGADEHIYVTDLDGPVDANYYIVSGSYVIDENAASRITELGTFGYKAYVMKEKSADLNRVVIDSTNDYAEALLLVAKYRKEIDPSAWIIKKRRF